jgi:predicted GNAT family N-acyltransferase
MLTVKRVENEAEFNDAFGIRTEVFIREQNVPEDIELDEFDKDADHVVIYLDNEAVGCGRVVMNEKKARIGRVAVLKKNRHSGIGKKICIELMKIAAERGADRIVLDAQLTAVGFYKKLGFVEFGNVFLEAGILHVKMARELTGFLHKLN